MVDPSTIKCPMCNGLLNKDCDKDTSFIISLSIDRFSHSIGLDYDNNGADYIAGKHLLICEECGKKMLNSMDAFSLVDVCQVVLALPMVKCLFNKHKHDTLEVCPHCFNDSCDCTCKQEIL